MAPSESADHTPVLLTHWDPDMYSEDALPLIPELVIQILVHGEVWLKDVDLFLNAKIVEQLDHEEQFEQFSSLVETGRVKVLIPDGSYRLIGPDEQPLVATAIEREQSKRPLATAEWRLTNHVRRYCERLDRVLVKAEAIKRRHLPKSENDFAKTMLRVLSLPELTWRGRPQFTGLDKAICDPFKDFCEDPRTAMAFLQRLGQKPKGDVFFRSMAYQCADAFPDQARPMKNLIQSVYAACELDREAAAGTFVGDKIAEIPPTSLDQLTEEDSKELISVRVESGLAAAQIPICRNIGEIIKAVLSECGDRMHTFWAKACYDTSPDEEFRDAWAHVADAFARHSRRAQPVALGQSERRFWSILGQVIYALNVGVYLDDRLGFRWVASHVGAEASKDVRILASAVAKFGPKASLRVRRGLAEAAVRPHQDRIQSRLMSSAVLRTDRIGLQ